MMRFQTQSKGQVLVLVALMMVVLLGLAALAIDLGRAYGVKAKLNAAVDAASLEAANSLAQGSGVSEMRRRAEEVAVSYFRANYPDKFLGATASAPQVTSTHDEGTGRWQVRVSATAQMPTIFAGFMDLGGGGDLFNVGATSEAVRATLDMALVLDTTNSLEGDFPKVKQSAQNFLEHFSQVDDRVALVAFSSGAYPMVSICREGETHSKQDPDPDRNCARGFDRTQIRQAIGFLNKAEGTDSEEGLKKALDQLNSLAKNGRSGKRAVVFFSDGAPNTFNGKFRPVGSPPNADPITGNLYSGPLAGEHANRIFNPGFYFSEKPVSTVEIASFEEMDVKGRFHTKGKRPLRDITNDLSESGILQFKCEANKAARNMAENVANELRSQGITIFAIGFGPQLNKPEVADESCSTNDEVGTTILKRFANTTDSDTYQRSQPTGIFCYAPTANDLERCFDQIAYGVLRITK